MDSDSDPIDSRLKFESCGLGLGLKSYGLRLGLRLDPVYLDSDLKDSDSDLVDSTKSLDILYNTDHLIKWMCRKYCLHN